MTDTNLVNLPQELIVELALGIEKDVDVGKRYGYLPDELYELVSQDWVKKKISEAKIELEKNGFNFQSKMALLAENLLVDTYKTARLAATTPQVKLDVAKYLSKLAGLEPVGRAGFGDGNASGPAFSIVITLPEDKGEKVILNAAQELPPKPEYIDGSID